MPETKQKKPIYKKWWFWIIILFVISTIGNAVNEETDVPTQNEETSQGIEKTTEAEAETEEETKVDPVKEKEDYIKLADTFDYKELERNPDEYKGEIAKFTGQVIQVTEGFFDTVIYRVNVTKNPEYDEDTFLADEWIDTIYVTYKRSEGEQRILEDDIIAIYGELDGIETYTSVMAGRISIPSVKAKYIDLIETADNE